MLLIASLAWEQRTLRIASSLKRSVSVTRSVAPFIVIFLGWSIAAVITWKFASCAFMSVHACPCSHVCMCLCVCACVYMCVIMYLMTLFLPLLVRSSMQARACRWDWVLPAHLVLRYILIGKCAKVKCCPPLLLLGQLLLRPSIYQAEALGHVGAWHQGWQNCGRGLACAPAGWLGETYSRNWWVLDMGCGLLTSTWI